VKLILPVMEEMTLRVFKIRVMRTWEDNIRMDLRQIIFENTKWTQGCK